MSKFLIDLQDGTICSFENTVIVDTDHIGFAGNRLLSEWNEGGNDSTARELGERFGLPIIIKLPIIEGISEKIVEVTVEELKEEIEKLKSSVMSLTNDLRTIRSVQKSQKMRDLWDRKNPYNNY